MNSIELHARPSIDYETKLAHAIAVLTSAASDHVGRIVQATSLGAEDMVLTHLIASQRLPIAVATLDTGKLHRETLQLIGRAEAALGLRIEVFAPAQQTIVQFVGRHGERAMFESNFPVDEVSCDYPTLWNALKLIAKGASAAVTTPAPREK